MKRPRKTLVELKTSLKKIWRRILQKKKRKRKKKRVVITVVVKEGSSKNSWSLKLEYPFLTKISSN